jgi:hypothetical protein
MTDTIEFYDVKEKRRVRIPLSDICKVAYTKPSPISGKPRTRYALRANFQGRKLVKFTKQATFAALDVPEEEP